MGNQCVQGIPVLITKNWQPVPHHRNSFRNRLTLQFVYRHIITISNQKEIESLKTRMHENNNYICRVLYYHQYHDDIYHVFADQMQGQLAMKSMEKWVQVKIRILYSFQNLAKIYGFMRVCEQMIGADFNGHPKIWIHPDPLSPYPWSPCQSETLMIADITSILSSLQQNIGRKSTTVTNQTKKKTMNKTFEQTIKEETKKIQKTKKNQNKINQSSHNIKNSTTNFNININIDLDNNNTKQKHNTTNKFYHNSTPYRLQKIFNPTICETTRNQQNMPKIVPHKISQEKSVNIRPFTEDPMKVKEMHLEKRRDSDFLKTQKRELKKYSDKNGSLEKKKVKFHSPEQQKREKTNVSKEKQKIKYEKSKLQILLSSYTKKNQTQNFSYQNLPNSNKKLTKNFTTTNGNNGATNKNIFKTKLSPKSKTKHFSIPKFLLKKFHHESQIYQKFKTCASVQKYSYQNRNKTTKKSEGDFFNESSKKSGSKNTMTIIQEELNCILQNQDIAPAVSKSYERFKGSKDLYKGSFEKQQDQEREQIKEKVEKKKATFADLKLQALKILQDD